MKPILIIGSDINAYYMARCYHELYKTKVDAFAVKRLQFTKFSGIMNITYIDNLMEEKAFVNTLIDYAKGKKYKEKILLIPCHDNYVRLIVENKKALEKYFIFNCPSIEIMDTLLVKEKFYEKYKDEFDFAKTYFYKKGKSETIPKDFRYPLIIKPSNGITYHQHHFLGQAKVYKVQTKKELEAILNQITNSGYEDNIIVQECILGDDSTLFDAVFYCDKNKKVVLSTFAQIGLQEHAPTAIGNCTVLINGYNQFGSTDKLVNKFKDFLEKIGYQGFCEFDIKYDLRDKKFKVLEINPRQARSSYYLAALGHNLVEYLIEDLYNDKKFTYQHLSEETLLTFVSKGVIKKHIKNEEYKKKALSLLKNKKWSDPLIYKGDKSIKQRIYLILRKVNYAKKYKKFTW